MVHIGWVDMQPVLLKFRFELPFGCDIHIAMWQEHFNKMASHFGVNTPDAPVMMGVEFGETEQKVRLFGREIFLHHSFIRRKTIRMQICQLLIPFIPCLFLFPSTRIGSVGTYQVGLAAEEGPCV